MASAWDLRSPCTCREVEARAGIARRSDGGSRHPRRNGVLAGITITMVGQNGWSWYIVSFRQEFLRYRQFLSTSISEDCGTASKSRKSGGIRLVRAWNRARKVTRCPMTWTYLEMMREQWHSLPLVHQILGSRRPRKRSSQRDLPAGGSRSKCMYSKIAFIGKTTIKI